MAPDQPARGRNRGSGCQHLAEMVVNIYGSEKLKKINNALSQVEVPLARSQASFSGQRKYEAREPVGESRPWTLLTFTRQDRPFQLETFYLIQKQE